MLTKALCDKHLSYDPASGELRRKSNNHRLTSLSIRLEGVHYTATSILWCMLHGSLPVRDVLHLNGDIKDFKSDNLVEAPEIPCPITQEFLLTYLELLDGKFRVIKRYSRNVQLGEWVGSKTQAGYLRLVLGAGEYGIHRLVWLYTYGNLPDESLDHISGDKLDNRPENLRLATVAQNGHNRGTPSTNTTGYKGVCWVESRKQFVAAATLHNKVHHLGYFKTAEEASAAYQAFAKMNHGEFYRAPAIV